MTKTLVTVLGLAGWAGAIALIVLLRGTTRPRSMPISGPSTWLRTGVLASRGAGGLAGSIVAGVLVMGLGGRLMMRILAATSPSTAQGAITDMEAVVGEVTVGGTIAFVLFVGAGAGIIGWIIRLVVRRWLPVRSVVAGIVGGAIGAGLLARSAGLLDPSNRDFAILTPDWLAVGLIVGLIATFGMLLGVLSDRWSQQWPTVQAPSSIVWLAPLAALIVLPPLAIGLGAATVARARIATTDDTVPWLATTDRVGLWIVRLAAILGAGVTLAGVAEIVGG